MHSNKTLYSSTLSILSTGKLGTTVQQGLSILQSSASKVNPQDSSPPEATLDSDTNKRWLDIHFDVKTPHQVLLEYKLFLKKEQSSKGKACVYCGTQLLCHRRNILHEYFIQTGTTSERIYNKTEKRKNK